MRVETGEAGTGGEGGGGGGGGVVYSESYTRRFLTRWEEEEEFITAGCRVCAVVPVNTNPREYWYSNFECQLVVTVGGR